MSEGFDEICDVVVVGSGAGGMSAAITAAKAGLKVVLIEKSEFIGGSTAVSGGAMWVPENPHAAKAGHADTREAAMSYVSAVLGNRLRPDLMRAFLDNGPEMVRFFERETALKFEARAYSPDYQPEQPGAAKGGRTIDPAPYDGNELGADFALLRQPLKEFTVLGGMMVNRKDIDALVGRFGSVANFWHSAKLLLQYGRDRLRHPRGARLLMGNALAGRLLKSARQAGVDLRVNTGADTLINRDGAVVGVVAKSTQGLGRIGSRRGVVLAAGGFPANAEMRRELMPHADTHRSMAPASDTGDGIRLGLAAGGALRDDNIGAAFWTPVSVLKKSDGSEVKFPHLILDRAKPGLIAVDSQGRRFVNEATSYHGFVEAMHAAGAVPAYLVCDSVFLRKYGLGLVYPGMRSPAAFVEAGYLYQGATLAELAAKIGVPAAALAAEASAMTAAAESGNDPAFGKGSSEYNRYLGDAARKPNPCLGPVETAPFYAVKVWPGDIGTATGLICDTEARVLGQDERPIPGLYACGNDMNSIMAGAYPGAGITLGPALTFGFIAGRALAAEPDHLPSSERAGS
ncbi:FAD-dependent oxidoreductase [Bosea sp. F3-2]|uniref:FAD-dependent oxidoreductase n=1 Tax=Bosea sp. F3-2 TaxID=2599640 RepID=UPI0011F00396|nr:FAD-dependent oxidoreductase [Bosea sp. F3-2]QEL25322.1 FAD-dependent oxidoreductase [Bosea sp. F3-2]